ncbi:Pecanex-like protein 1 [Gossypium arboreum]|uniref:Pecanex-like protein 1 n=1 Tax=Gossypium arboreum TaxID=29729 RepID=A0A0B0MQH5_GOSAR|nr:Pecanex-like protein 1 [Gossypium arboreum]
MTFQETALKLYSTLCEVKGLTEDEHYSVLSKIPDHPTQMLIFFSLPSSVWLEWVRRFLANH